MILTGIPNHYASALGARSPGSRRVTVAGRVGLPARGAGGPAWREDAIPSVPFEPADLPAGAPGAATMITVQLLAQDAAWTPPPSLPGSAVGIAAAYRATHARRVPEPWAFELLGATAPRRSLNLST